MAMHRSVRGFGAMLAAMALAGGMSPRAASHDPLPAFAIQPQRRSRRQATAPRKGGWRERLGVLLALGSRTAAEAWELHGLLRRARMAKGRFARHCRRAKTWSAIATVRRIRRRAYEFSSTLASHG